jgi:hypothetical protein
MGTRFLAMTNHSLHCILRSLLRVLGDSVVSFPSSRVFRKECFHHGVAENAEYTEGGQESMANDECPTQPGEGESPFSSMSHVKNAVAI